MENVPANVLWLQNNNNNPPGPRQQNPVRQNQSQGPNGQSPQRSASSLNRWLLVIVLLMLGVYLFQFFNASSNSTPTKAELQYGQFYQQITEGNIQSATIIGSTDITGKLCTNIQ